MTESLPFHEVIGVTSEDLDRNPQFSLLLQDLAQNYLTPDAVSKEEDTILTEATDTLEGERARYLTSSLIHNEVCELLTDHFSTGDKSVSPSRAGLRQALSHLEHQMATASAAQALKLSDIEAHPEKESVLLGVTPHFLHATQMPAAVLQTRKHAVQQHVIPVLESQLARKCDAISEFYSGGDDGSSGLMMGGRDIASDISAEVATLTSERTVLHRKQNSAHAEFWECFKATAKCLEVLVTLLSVHKAKLQREADQVESRSLAARCHTMCRKLAVVKNQFLKDTYTTETVAALRVIKQELTAAYDDATTTLEQSEARLAQYRNVGLGFDSHVSTYAALLDDIKDKEWALSQLQQAQ